MADHLPERDESYLNSKGFRWELFRDGDGLWLVIIGFGFSAAHFDREQLPETPPVAGASGMDAWERSLNEVGLVLLVKIPPQYPQAKLDMFWVWPHLRLKGRSDYPDRANHFEQHVGRNVQLFSRHLAQWRPGIDGVAGYLALINGILNPR